MRTLVQNKVMFGHFEGISIVNSRTLSVILDDKLEPSVGSTVGSGLNLSILFLVPEFDSDFPRGYTAILTPPEFPAFSCEEKEIIFELDEDSEATRTALLPCGHLDFESAVTAQNNEFKAVFVARIHAC